MKYITKSSVEPNSLSDWKAKSRMFQRKTAKWHKFSKGKDGREYKKEFTENLREEQGYICCYCEQKLNINDCHLEHFIPQSLDKFSETLFDYNNLLCSCQLELETGEPRHCGNSKGSWYNENLLVSPLDRDCESKFTYTEDGYIEHTDKASEETIKHLQLNIDNLNTARAKAIEPFILDPITYEEISLEEAKLFAEDYLKQKNGRYNEFHTTIKYLFTQGIE